jgi:hypothetical protein
LLARRTEDFAKEWLRRWVTDVILTASRPGEVIDVNQNEIHLLDKAWAS